MRVFTKIVFIILLLSSAFAGAQKISLTELHTLATNKNWDTSNQFLLSKGWDFYNSYKEETDNFNVIEWSFNKSKVNDKKAIGWMYVATFDGQPRKVLYRFRDKEYYIGIKSQLAAHKYALTDEELQNEKVVAKYANANFVLELTYSRVDDKDDDLGSGSYTAYELEIYKKVGAAVAETSLKKEFYEDGTLHLEYGVKDGKMHGLMKEYNPDGTLMRTATMLNEKEDGPATDYFYDENKKIKSKYSGVMKGGAKIGKWEMAYIDGEKERVIDFEHYLNDVLHGEYQKSVEDTLVIGNFSNGKLEGRYRAFHDPFRNVPDGLIHTDTTDLVKIRDGQFKENKAAGYWKYYYTSGTPAREGAYADSLKTGTWKYYHPKITDAQQVEPEYSQKLYLEENYQNGQLNGRTITYSQIDKEEVPCPKPGRPDCFKYVYKKARELTHYTDGQLNGLYELYDQNDALIERGEYLNNEPHGEWTVTNVGTLDPEIGLSTETGHYNNGKKSGEWKRVLDGKPVQILTYAENELHGNQTTFANGKPKVVREYEKGKVRKLTLNDDTGNFNCEYNILKLGEREIICQQKRKTDNRVLLDTYVVTPKDFARFDPSSFDKHFSTLTPEEKILDGLHSATADGKLLEQGDFTSNKKTGSWQYYHYTQGVKLTCVYTAAGEVKSEMYYDIKKQELFSGEFLYNDTASGIVQEIKVKNGLRNGTTRYKDQSDKTIKKETYKDGVLKI